MFTDISIATPQFPGSIFGTTQFVIQTPEELHASYRTTAFGLIDVSNPSLFYRVHHNAEGSFNGQAVHEKLIYNGMSVIDVSRGNLDFPWFTADANPMNEISREALQVLANNEMDLVVSPRLRAIADFATTLPPYTRYYHYRGRDGVRCLVVDDPINLIKMSCVLTQFFQD